MIGFNRNDISQIEQTIFFSSLTRKPKANYFESLPFILKKKEIPSIKLLFLFTSIIQKKKMKISLFHKKKQEGEEGWEKKVGQKFPKKINCFLCILDFLSIIFHCHNSKFLFFGIVSYFR